MSVPKKWNEVEFKNYREIAEFLHPIYQSNNWTWGWGKTSHVPSVAELEDEIMNLVRDVGPKENDTLATGRLLVVNGINGVEINLTLAIPEMDFE